eukprot:g31345.t1
MYTRNKRVVKERVGLLKDKGGNLCVELEELSEVLNEHFTMVFTKEKDMEDVKIREGYVHILGHVDIKKEEVLGVLKNIKVDKSLGPDGIYPRMLKEAREEIAGVLTEIFVSSLVPGKVPENWTITNIVPFFKKGLSMVAWSRRLSCMGSMLS